ALIVAALDAQQRAIADAGHRAGPGMARDVDTDFGSLALLDLVPFGGSGDQLAIGVAAGDVGEQRRRQRGGLDNLLAVLLDRVLIDKIAQDALELGAVGILQAELARDFLGSDLSGVSADESDDGVPGRKAIVVFLLHLATCLSGALLGPRLRRSRRFGRRSLRCGGNRRARLADGNRFRLGGLLRRRLFHWLGWLGHLGIRRGRLRLRRLPGLALAAAFGRPLVDQRDRLGERDRVLVLVARNRGIDAARGDIGAIAAVLDRDRAKGRMVAELPARVGAEAPAAGSLRQLLRNQRHRAVEPDVEDLVAGLQARIGFVMLHEWPEAADAGRDRQARLRMLADLARQRQQL